MDNTQQDVIRAALHSVSERARTVPGFAERWLMALGTITLAGETHADYGGPPQPDRRLDWGKSTVRANGNEVFTAMAEGHTLVVESVGWTGKWVATLDGEPVHLFDGLEPVEGMEQVKFPNHIDAMLALEARALGEPT